MNIKPLGRIEVKALPPEDKCAVYRNVNGEIDKYIEENGAVYLINKTNKKIYRCYDISLSPEELEKVMRDPFFESISDSLLEKYMSI
ncbi:MAG: hypothetical protein LBG48_02245 [Rickettsiales bacterium]|jgi:hypothetical protein|nr:hypothetical protein [Rickettsiales bacterium]